MTAPKVRSPGVKSRHRTERVERSIPVSVGQASPSQCFGTRTKSRQYHWMIGPTVRKTKRRLCGGSGGDRGTSMSGCDHLEIHACHAARVPFGVRVGWKPLDFAGPTATDPESARAMAGSVSGTGELPASGGMAVNLLRMERLGLDRMGFPYWTGIRSVRMDKRSGSVGCSTVR